MHRAQSVVCDAPSLTDPAGAKREYARCGRFILLWVKSSKWETGTCLARELQPDSHDPEEHHGDQIIDGSKY
jgi:hypothetical protein